MFPKITIAENRLITLDLIILSFIDCAANQEGLNRNQKWTKSKDKILVQKKTDYSLTMEGVWKDEYGKAWFGREIKLEMECPQWATGPVYVHFSD